MHRPRHAFKKEGLCRTLTAVAIRRSDQLFCFGHRNRCEEIGERGLQGATEPDVEEVREVGVSNVVVVGRIRGHDLIR